MKKFFSNIIKILVYLSVLFLIIYLIKSDKFVWPKSINYFSLIFSIIVLLAGFILQSLRWFLLLKQDIPNIKIKHAYISHGITILGKYIPGKIWMIVGKAFIISKIYDRNVAKISIILVQNQLIALWSGLIVGGGIIYKFKNDQTAFIALGLFIILTSILFFINYGESFFNFLKIFKKQKILFPKLSYRKFITIIPLYLINWLVFAFAFKLMVNGLNIEIDFFTSTSFVLAIVIGIAAFIFPGGMGIREGIIYASLILVNIPKNEIILIAAFSRVWFLIGEILIFISSLILNKFKLS